MALPYLAIRIMMQIFKRAQMLSHKISRVCNISMHKGIYCPKHHEFEYVHEGEWRQIPWYMTILKSVKHGPQPYYILVEFDIKTITYTVQILKVHMLGDTMSYKRMNLHQAIVIISGHISDHRYSHLRLIRVMSPDIYHLKILWKNPPQIYVPSKIMWS